MPTLSRTIGSQLRRVVRAYVRGATALWSPTYFWQDLAYPDDPTIVFVHGAWTDTSTWEQVMRRLQSRGFRTLAHACGLTSLGADSAHLKQRLRGIDGPVVLVGHGYGAGVIANAGADNPEVKAVVYLNGLVPLEGETITDVVGHDSVYSVDAAATELDLVPHSRGRGRTEIDCYLPLDTFVHRFASDLPPSAARLLWAAQRPLTLGALDEASGKAASEVTPSWYLVGTEDRVLPPHLQEAIAARCGSTVARRPTGHLGHVAEPDWVVDVVVSAVHCTASRFK